MRLNLGDSMFAFGTGRSSGAWYAGAAILDSTGWSTDSYAAGLAISSPRGMRSRTKSGTIEDGEANAIGAVAAGATAGAADAGDAVTDGIAIVDGAAGAAVVSMIVGDVAVAAAASAAVALTLGRISPRKPASSVGGKALDDVLTAGVGSATVIADDVLELIMDNTLELCVAVAVIFDDLETLMPNSSGI